MSHSHKGAGPVPGSAAGYLPKVAPSQHRQQPEVVHLEPPAGAANTEERPQVKEVIGVKEPAEDRTHCGGSRGSPSAFALGEFLQQDKQRRRVKLMSCCHGNHMLTSCGATR